MIARLRSSLPAFSSLLSLALAAVARGQSSFDEPFPGDAPAGGGFSLDWNGWPVEVALLILAFVVASFFMFLVIFPWLLQKARPVWPLTAYGICLCLICTVCFAAGLWLFWENLVLDTEGSVSFIGEHGLRLGLVVAWLILAAIILAVFRSSRGRTAAA